MKSSKLSSAQWRSSKTRTSGLRSARLRGTSARPRRPRPAGRPRRALRRPARRAGEGGPRPTPDRRRPRGLRRRHPRGSRCSLVRRVGLEDSRVGLHHLAESPVGHSLAVRQAAALPPVHELRVLPRRAAKSSETSRLLPIPGTPTSVTSCVDRSCLARWNVSTRVRARSRARRGRAAALGDVDAVPRTSLDRLPRRDRLCLALRLDGLRGRSYYDRLLASRGTSSRRRGSR